MQAEEQTGSPSGSLTQRQRHDRADLELVLRRELLGPADSDTEELSSRERPTLRYLLGRLAPAGTAIPADEDEGAADAGGADDEDSDTGYASPIAMSMNPSSIGLSVVTEPSVKQLEITMRWGRYHLEERDREGADGRVQKERLYCRQPNERTITLDLNGPQEPFELDVGVFAEFLVRAYTDGRSAVSVFLVNRIDANDPGRPDDDGWLFQPEISIRAPGGEPAFAARRLEDVAWTDDPDLIANELLYWNRPEYAVGHGCAVAWTALAGSREPAHEVRTDVLPVYELPRVDPRESDDRGLDMRTLGGSSAEGVSGSELRAYLTPLTEQYQVWINQRLRGELLPRVPSKLQAEAASHIDAAQKALERMLGGIELIATNDAARRAFCFANRAMALQRERSVRALARRRGEAPRLPVRARWRPFQLAFILLNLPALADRGHPDRTVGDLLWFPTGGGKTEAYLGLTAFALTHRRLRAPLKGFDNSAGVTVLMRYTLRLLTIQQFQRATTLICACEHLRLAEGVWGDERFSIGLWVGQSATPNSYSNSSPYGDPGAKEALDRLERGHSPRGGNPVQLLYCPWCGAKLTQRDRGSSIQRPISGTYVADDDAERVDIFCPDEECDFSVSSDGIPAHVVDDQLYHHVPSLVIATVDKFARMPFNGRTQALFGRVNRNCSRHGFLTAGESHSSSHRESKSVSAATVRSISNFEPPELIIQDELHLISGPLGTLVGLYETAVDLLSSVALNGKRIGPKVIASTATVRRADRQIGALFNRRLAVFPPPGIDASDSWFATETSLDVAPGRLYLGIFAPGKSVKTALVRVYAALLSRAKALLASDPQAADPYMTLVGYFNSLRELGGALRLIEDDVPGRIKVLHRRDKETWQTRSLYEREELTSNKRAEEIPKIIDKLERRFTADPPKIGEYPVDTVMASNMISVGVDIDRLGLMVVNGQPKTTAEYIQATSRVGRQSPGLVVTVYNWTRPRDISHYEKFRAYHGSLYRFVEATSVTPFSARARDKGLEGVFAAAVRLGDPSLSGEQDAARFAPDIIWVREVTEAIAARAAAVGVPSNEAEFQTREELVADMDHWSDAVAPDMLSYTRRGISSKTRKDNPGKRYLLDSQEDSWKTGVFVAPGSLREVESEVPVYLLDADLTDNGGVGID
jgi:hypothetical protein